MFDLDISKTKILRLHIAVVASIHSVNAIALWFRYGAGDSRGRDTFVAFFSVSSEGKLPTWFSAVTLLACGLLLALISAAKYRDRDPHRMYWLLLSAIFFYISFDEAMEVHEKLGPVLGAVLEVTGPQAGWVVPGLIGLSALSLMYSRFLFRLPPRSRNLFLAAGGVYVSGTLGMELVGNAYKSSNAPDLTYGIIATIEEILEMGGIVIFVYALLDYLETKVCRRASITLF